MSAGDTQPTQPLPDGAAAEPPARRRRVWPWIVAAAVVVLLAVAAWFAGEWIARETVTRTVREQVVEALDLPADHPIEVGVAGLVLPQLIVGTLDEVTVAGDDLPLGPVTGDVSVIARDVPVRGDGAAGDIQAELVLDGEQLSMLLTGLEDFPDAEVSLVEPDVRVDTAFDVFGLEVPVAVSLTPSAHEGDITLEPAGIEVAGATLTADQVRDQFGLIASAVLQDWTICIAEYLPAGITLEQIDVVGDEVVAHADVDGAIATDESLQQPGTCA